MNSDNSTGIGSSSENKILAKNPLLKSSLLSTSSAHDRFSVGPTYDLSCSDISAADNVATETYATASPFILSLSTVNSSMNQMSSSNTSSITRQLGLDSDVIFDTLVGYHATLSAVKKVQIELIQKSY